jgi:putative membrane protein
MPWDVSVAAAVLAVVVGVQHVAFMLLESVFFHTKTARKVFRMTEEQARAVGAWPTNQGVYNGFLAAGLFWGVGAGGNLGVQVLTFFLICVIVAGVVGAATVSKRIFFIQSTPAAVALLVLWLTA